MFVPDIVISLSGIMMCFWRPIFGQRPVLEIAWNTQYLDIDAFKTEINSNIPSMPTAYCQRDFRGVSFQLCWQCLLKFCLITRNTEHRRGNMFRTNHQNDFQSANREHQTTRKDYIRAKPDAGETEASLITGTLLAVLELLKSQEIVTTWWEGR